MLANIPPGSSTALHPLADSQTYLTTRLRIPVNQAAYACSAATVWLEGRVKRGLSWSNRAYDEQRVGEIRKALAELRVQSDTTNSNTDARCLAGFLRRYVYDER